MLRRHLWVVAAALDSGAFGTLLGGLEETVHLLWETQEHDEHLAQCLPGREQKMLASLFSLRLCP